MANKKDKNKDLEKESIYNLLLTFYINGDRSKLNQKNKKLLKMFEQEVTSYEKRIFFLLYVQDDFLSWSSLLDSINENFDKLIYLLNEHKETINILYLKRNNNLEEKYMIINSKKVQNVHTEPILSYEDIGKKVGLK